MKMGNFSAITGTLREVYGDPPWYVLAHKEGKLSKLESLIYEAEIKEWADQPVTTNTLKDLVYSKNPFLNVIPKGNKLFGSIHAPFLPEIKE